MNGSAKDYAFGQKNNWRRTVWNDVLSRTRGLEKTHPVLYMPGPDDIDRDVAACKGVPSRNLIAIDRSFSNVANVRRTKNPAVCADVFRVLSAWPVDRPVCAIMLDLCCGMTMYLAKELQALLLRQPFWGAAVMVNMMRGRDAETNEIRAVLSRCGALRMAADMVGQGYLSDKHRGLCLTVWNGSKAWASCVRVNAGDWEAAADQIFCSDEDVWRLLDGRHFKIAGCEFISRSEEVRDKLHELAAAKMAVREKPRYYTYRSGVLVFDSVVLSNTKVGGLLPREYVDNLDERLQLQKDGRTSRKVSAMLAVRTQRSNRGAAWNT